MSKLRSPRFDCSITIGTRPAMMSSWSMVGRRPATDVTSPTSEVRAGRSSPRARSAKRRCDRRRAGRRTPPYGWLIHDLAGHDQDILYPAFFDLAFDLGAEFRVPVEL